LNLQNNTHFYNVHKLCDPSIQNKNDFRNEIYECNKAMDDLGAQDDNAAPRTHVATRMPFFAGSPEFTEFIYYEYFFVLRHIRNLFEAYFIEHSEMTNDEQIQKFDFRLDQWKHFFIVKWADNKWNFYPYTDDPGNILEVYRHMYGNAQDAIALFSDYAKQDYGRPPQPTHA